MCSSDLRELVKTDDLKQKLEDWDETFREIKEDKIDALTDLISEADFFVEKKDYSSAVKKIASIEINLETLKKRTDNLLEEIKVITNSEERNRSIVTKLKAIYREAESKYERTKKDYYPLEEYVEDKLYEIDQEFKKFEYCTAFGHGLSRSSLKRLFISESITSLSSGVHTVPSSVSLAEIPS